MRRKWIIPLVICLLLFVSYFFRWEQGPEQAGEKINITHMKDRWTGQSWIKAYGFGDGKLYSGEMAPVISPNEIEKRKIQILSQQEEVLKKQELDRILTDAEQTMKDNEWGHAKYIEYVDKKYEIANQSNILKFGRPSEYGNSRYGEYESGIPQNFIENQQVYLDAMHVKWEANGKITEQINQAEIRAESELKTWAWQERKIATYTWVGLIIVLGSLSLFLFMRRKK